MNRVNLIPVSTKLKALDMTLYQLFVKERSALATLYVGYCAVFVTSGDALQCARLASVIITRCAVAQHCVIGNINQWEMANVDPLSAACSEFFGGMETLWRAHWT